MPQGEAPLNIVSPKTAGGEWKQERFSEICRKKGTYSGGRRSAASLFF